MLLLKGVLRKLTLVHRLLLVVLLLTKNGLLELCVGLFWLLQLLLGRVLFDLFKELLLLLSLGCQLGNAALVSLALASANRLCLILEELLLLALFLLL